MIVMDSHEMFQNYCKLSNYWGLTLCLPNYTDANLDKFPEGDYFGEVFKAAPYLEEINKESSGMQAISDGLIFLFFDSEEEMKKYYYLTVGDDGPTETNHYNGPARIYALTCNPLGQFKNENT